MSERTPGRERPDLAGSQPPLLYPPYVSTRRRAPSRPLIRIPETLADLNVPVYGWSPVGAADSDLTRQHDEEPHGQRIIVAGRVLRQGPRTTPGTPIQT